MRFILTLLYIAQALSNKLSGSRQQLKEATFALFFTFYTELPRLTSCDVMWMEINCFAHALYFSLAQIHHFIPKGPKCLQISRVFRHFCFKTLQCAVVALAGFILFYDHLKWQPFFMNEVIHSFVIFRLSLIYNKPFR